MVAYLFISCFPLLFGLFFKKIKSDKKERRIFCITCFIVLFLFLALRSEFVGNNDTNNYCDVYEYATKITSLKQFLDEKKSMESGFLIYVFVLSRFLRFRQALIISSSFIFAGSASLFIYKNSKNVSLSFLIYITLGLMIFEATAMRQGIAISICMLAFSFSKKRKFILFVLSVLLAFTFHKTAIVFLIVYPLGFLKKNWLITAAFVLVGVSCLFFGNTIMSYANDYFGKEYVNKVESGGYVMVLTYVALVFLAIIYPEIGPYKLFKKINNNAFNNGRILYLSIITLFCYLLRYYGGQAAERLCYYFVFLELIVFPNAIERIKDKNSSLFAQFIFSVFIIALFCYRLYGSDLVPYYFFWR